MQLLDKFYEWDKQNRRQSLGDALIGTTITVIVFVATLFPTMVVSKKYSLGEWMLLFPMAAMTATYARTNKWADERYLARGSNNARKNTI